MVGAGESVFSNTIKMYLQAHSSPWYNLEGLIVLVGGKRYPLKPPVEGVSVQAGSRIYFSLGRHSALEQRIALYKSYE